MKIALFPYFFSPEGISYGYFTHFQSTKKMLPLVPMDTADMVLHIAPPHFYKHQKGKVNVFFTMWEAEDLSPDFYPAIDLADAVIVPCTHNVRLFSKATKRPVYLCPEAIDTETFAYKKRRWPEPDGHPFRVLWVGSPSERKGWRILSHIWEWGGFIKRADMELYIKTTHATLPNSGDIAQGDNVIIDNRNLTTQQMVELYHSAHCLLYPTMGEGWALPCCESMSTGLPVIVTRYSGPADYCTKKTGYPIDYKLINVDYGIRTKAALVNRNEAIKILNEIVYNYKNAVLKGKNAARFIRENFTEEIVKKKLLGILKLIKNIQVRLKKE